MVSLVRMITAEPRDQIRVSHMRFNYLNREAFEQVHMFRSDFQNLLRLVMKS